MVVADKKRIEFNKKRRLRRRRSLDYSKTTTGKGYRWEVFAANLLKADLHPSGIMTGPYDIVWKKKKVDVKSANLYYRRFRNGHPVDPSNQVGVWRFDRGEIYKKDLDYFFCICLRDNIPVKWYMIPNSVFPKRGVTITERTKKYSEYLI